MPDSENLSILPPEYFPGPVLAGLLLAADTVILADTFQYSRQSFQNRCRIRTPDGFQWVTVPVGHGQAGTSIHKIRIDGDSGWRTRHKKAFRFNYGSSPFYEHYRPSLEKCIDLESDRLADVTCATADFLRRAITPETNLLRASELPGAPDTVAAILDAQSAGRHLIPESLAQINRIPGQPSAELHINPIQSRQVFDGFVPDLSFVDILFNHGPDAIRILRDSLTITHLPDPAT